jgi:hypothetical protein
LNILAMTCGKLMDAIFLFMSQASMLGDTMTPKPVRLLEQVAVLEMAETGGDLTCLHGNLDALRHTTKVDAGS